MILSEIQALASSSDSNVKQLEKIYVPLVEQKKYNLVGRLLGPKGMTLKRIQAETQTKMSILGRSSMKDKQKEEELRGSSEPAHQHLKDDLHILIEANPPCSSHKLAAGVAEVRKMLIPPVKKKKTLYKTYTQQDNQAPKKKEQCCVFVLYKSFKCTMCTICWSCTELVEFIPAVLIDVWRESQLCLTVLGVGWVV